MVRGGDAWNEALALLTRSFPAGVLSLAVRHLIKCYVRYFMMELVPPR